MAGAVGDDRLERRRLAGELEDVVGDLLDRALDARADVVGLALTPALEHDLDRPAVVEDVEPLAPVLRRRVERQVAVFERVRHEQRDHLLGELEGPVVVRAVRDRDRQSVGLGVRAHGMVGSRLGGVVRRARPVRRLLREDLVALERQVAVDLAGRDVVEARHARAPRRLQQRLRPEHVGAEEARRLDDREAVVRLGGEIDDGVDLLPLEQPLAELEVGDVALHELDLLLDRGEAAPVACVREQVEHDDAVAGMPLEPVADEVGADEAGAACHQQVHGSQATSCRSGEPA